LLQQGPRSYPWRDLEAIRLAETSVASAMRRERMSGNGTDTASGGVGPIQMQNGADGVVSQLHALLAELDSLMAVDGYPSIADDRAPRMRSRSPVGSRADAPV
jgi:hypothetical protein